MTGRELLTEIKADCERDARALDGQAFTGRNVASAIGQVLAMVNALCDEMLRIHDTLDDEPKDHS